MTENLPMSVARASEIVLGSPNGCLGEPSKMPGYSFGISASKCKRGNKLARDLRTVCGHCYAKVAFYHYYDEVQVAHKRRFKGITHPEWVPAMIALLLHYVDPKMPYFRWFDSGDLQSVRMLGNIVEVCLGTPKVKHFLPTRETGMLVKYLRLAARGEAPAFPKNLCVRISADLVGKPPMRIREIEELPTSTVHRGKSDRNKVIVPWKKVSYACKAHERAVSRDGSGQCGGCRACWSRNAGNVSFGLHNERRADYSLALPFKDPVVESVPTPIVTSWKRGRKYAKPGKPERQLELAPRQRLLPIFR
jgi:hypothetical protein